MLKKNNSNVVIGGNIGKNSTTSNENADADYIQNFETLHQYVDYFVLNVSCPNVGSHAKLNDKDYLEELIGLVPQEVSTVYEEVNKREARILDLNAELGNKYRYHNIIGKSKKMQEIYHLLTKVSNSEATILIQGENGTGKELDAKAIHFVARLEFPWHTNRVLHGTNVNSATRKIDVHSPDLVDDIVQRDLVILQL